MNKDAALIITSISAPNRALRAFSEGCAKHDVEYFLIGDSMSPDNFSLAQCRFYSLDEQHSLSFEYVRLCPERHYSRKNIGYLIAANSGAELIVESDDDNFPYPAFWEDRKIRHTAIAFEDEGWVNVYAHYSGGVIWPRGYPLEYVNRSVKPLDLLSFGERDCPIQQGLANKNPDVDAVFRLTRPLPHTFVHNHKLALGVNSWCPYNSQNTVHFRQAFPLLYLPSYCSFRMTDIWRSFVGQRIAWENDWSILFEQATVWQERNEHNLLKDFEDETPGFLNNARICSTLEQLRLEGGSGHIGDNMLRCYRALVDIDVMDHRELTLLNAWLKDIC